MPGGQGPAAEALHAAFRLFDTNGDGTLSKDELAAVFTRPTGLRPPLTPVQFDELFRKIDLDGDGRITYAEFVSDLTPTGLAALEARPARREIKVFVVLRTRLASVKYTGEPIEIYDEFWVHHPHGKQPLLSEFVAIVLTDEQVDEQLKDIRLSSYRWKDIKGIGVVDEEGQQQYQTPGNFGWFLELCKEHGWIGWIDGAFAYPCDGLQSVGAGRTE